MKKICIKIVCAILLVGMISAVAPKYEVSAYTSYYDMNYDEVCGFWSSQPAFYQIYLAEYQKSGYSDQVKFNILTYFKCSLNDFVWNNSALQQSRPLTYNYVQAVLSVSNPNIINVIKGNTSSESLRAVLMEEMKDKAPYLTYNERCQNADILLELLKKVGVTNKDQYKLWKKANGGKTAFEVFINHVLDYNDYWNKVKQATIETAMEQQEKQQEEFQENVEKAYEEQQNQIQEMQDILQEQQNQQMEMINKMLGR